MTKHWSEFVFCPHCGKYTLVPRETEFYKGASQVGRFHCIRCGKEFTVTAEFEATKVKVKK